MVHFTGLLENARHPGAGLLSGEPWWGPPGGGPCKNRVRAGIGGSPGTATGGQIHVVHISHTHPPKELIQALRKYLLGKKKHAEKRFLHKSDAPSPPCKASWRACWTAGRAAGWHTNVAININQGLLPSPAAVQRAAQPPSYRAGSAWACWGPGQLSKPGTALSCTGR